MTPPATDRPGFAEKTLSSDRVQVVFRWVGDRWVHALHALCPDGSRAAACWQTAPVSPGDEATWPSSPPLVELGDVPMPHGTAIVGVGSAGTTHYSVSVSAAPEGGLRFEFACRLLTPAGWLGTTYAADGAGSTLSIEPLGNAVATTIAAPDGGLAGLQIVPAPADTPSPCGAEKGSTVQWSYRVCVPEVG